MNRGLQPLNQGSPDVTKFQRSDGTWQVPNSVPAARGIPGDYIGPLVTSATTANVSNRLALLPIWIPFNMIAVGIVCNVSTAATGSSGGVARMGIYGSDPVTLRPSGLLLDAGVISTESTGSREIAISQPLTAGLYYTTAVAQVSGCTIRTGLPPINWAPAGSSAGLTEAFSGPLVWIHATAYGATSASAVSVTGALPYGLVLGYNNNGGATSAPTVFLKVGGA